MGQFKPMVKMFTDEPSVILKLKKGGKVSSKAAKQEEGFKSMASNNAKVFEDAENGVAPKRPSMSERRKAMNPNQYTKGGKVVNKQMGGAMPMQGAPAPAMPMVPAAPQAMGRQALMGMTPNKRMARAAMVQKALSGMKKGGSADPKCCAALEKELKHHESLSMAKAHPMKKASGGAIDRDETRTTIEGNTKKFVNTKVDDGSKKDRAHGTGIVKEGKPGGYATGGSIPADTDKKFNKGRVVMGGTIEGNAKDYATTEMHQAKPDRSSSNTGGVRMANAGGFKKGGKVPGIGNAIEHDGDWENRPADGTPPGKTNTTTGNVKLGNGGGFKRGGHASKKAYATGGQVIDDGRAEKMPRHFVSRPVANSLQSGTFAKGGKVEKEEKPNLRLLKTHTGPKGHVAKVYKDRDWGEHRVKFFSPEGKHHAEGDYHTDDLSDAHDTAIGQLNRYKKGGRAHFADGGTEDLSKGAYDRHYADEKKENEAMRDSILGAPKRAYDAVKSMFSPSKPPEGSVTKTEKSVTVAPAKRRGGSMK